MLPGIIASAIKLATGGVTYESEITALSPIVRWKLGEASGATTLADEVASFDFDNVDSGDLTFGVAGLLNKGTSIVGTNGGVGYAAKDISGTHALSGIGAANSAYSVVAWLRPIFGSTNSNSDSDWWCAETALELRTSGGSGNHIPFNIGQDNGKFCFRRFYNRFNSGDTVRSVSPINDGEEHFCVATVESDGTTKLYIDGNEDISTTVSIADDASVGADSSYLSLFSRSTDNGGRNGKNPFEGGIDDVSIFDYALSAIEISDLYDAGKIPKTPPQNFDKKIEDLTIDVLNTNYWKMAETSGGVAADEIGGDDGSYAGLPTLGQTALFSGLNTCVGFNGVDQWVNMGNINVDNYGKKTIVVAVEFNDVNSDQIIIKEGGAGNGFGLGITGGNLAVGINSGSTGVNRAEYAVSNLSNGISYFIVGTIDTINNRLELYLNGSLVASQDVSLGGHNGSCQFNLAMTGCDNSTSNFQNPLTGISEEVWFDGKMSNFAAFNYILSSQEVSDLYDYATGTLP